MRKGLEKREKLSKTLNSKIVHHGMIYLAASFITQFVPFALIPVLTRFLMPVDYGITATFNVVVSVLVVLIGLGMTGVIGVQYYNSTKEDFVEYCSTSINLVFITAFIISVVFAVFIRSIAPILQLPLQWIFLSILVALFQIINSITSSLWQMQKCPIQFGAFQIAQSIINLSLSLVLIVVFKMKWEGRLYAILIANFIMSIVAWSYLVRKGFYKFRFASSRLKEILILGLPLIPHGLAGWLFTGIDRLFLNSMSGLSETGLYSVGYSLGSIISIAVLAFNNAWVPEFYSMLSKKDNDVKLRIVKISYVYIFLLFIATLIFSLFMPLMLSFFVGEKYYNARYFIAYIAFGCAFQGIAILFVNYLYFLKKTILIPAITLSTGFINVIFNIFLIKSNGSIGAAQSNLIANAVSAILMVLIANKYCPMPWFFRKTKHDKV
jgi:O-antigen/teichoic acid export membrane protein